MKMKRMFLMGSLCAAALTAAGYADAADDVVVETKEEVVVEAPSNAAAIAASDAEAAEPEDTSAKSRGFYAGGSIGGSFFDPSKRSRIYNRSTGDDNDDGQPDAFTVNDVDNENNFMWTVFFGYRLADWLGVEVGWTDLGGFRAIDTGPDFEGDTTHKNTVSPSVDGVEARVRGWIPLGTDRVAGLGGIGVYIYQAHGGKKCLGPDESACTKNPGHFDRVPSALDPTEDSGQALTVSAGLQFMVTENVHLRTEYQHFFSVLDQGVHMVTASVVVGFYDLFGQGKGGDSFGGIVVE